MKKHLCIILALALIFTAFAISGASADTTVVFSGLPESGTSKTENGVAFSIENKKGATSVTNNGGSIGITSTGWNQADIIFAYTVNSSTHKGTVRFEYDFSLAAALNGTLYMRYNENQATKYFSAGVGTHKMAFVYDAKSGEAIVELDGINSWSGTIDSATGISKVFMRVMGGSGTAEMTLSNASVICEETMTGYGTYFSGLPTNSSFSKKENGVSFNMKKSGNDKAKYSYTKDGGILFETEGYNQVDGVIDYIVNSSTHDGIVGFDFYVKSDNIIPEINVKINNNTYTKFIRNISAGEHKISFAYNTKTKEGKVYLNGGSIANTVLDEIQSVTLRLFAPNTTGSFVLSNADVKYVENADAIGNLVLTKNQDSCTASVIIMSGEYSFLPENMKFAILSYIGNRVEKIDFKTVLLTPGENRLSGTLSGLSEESIVKAFLWKADLSPVKFAQ